MRAQAIIDKTTVNGSMSATDFIERCEAGGLSVSPNIASTGRLSGYSFECDGMAFKGRQLEENTR